MSSTLYHAYRPAMMWLCNLEADILQERSLPSAFAKSDCSIAISGRPYQQHTRNEISILAERRSRKGMFGVKSSSTERQSLWNTYDELFLPSEKIGHENVNTSTRPVHRMGRPAQTNLHPAQRLPKTEKPIYSLPERLVAGLHPSSPSSPFRATSLASKGLDHSRQALKVGPSRTPIEIHDEHIKSANAQLQKNRQRSSAQMLDSIQSAHVPSHYDLYEQADDENFQRHSTLPPELPPLRVISSFRYSGIFPTRPAEARSSDEIQRTPQTDLPHQRATQKTLDMRIGTAKLHINSTNLKPSKRQKGRSNGVSERFDSVQNADSHYHKDFSRKDTDQGFQALKCPLPELPPLRAVSPLRFSQIFPASLRAPGPISSPPQAASQIPGKSLEKQAPRLRFPSNLDGSNDLASSDLETSVSGRIPNTDPNSNISSHEAFHKRIRRRRGYKNLRIAATNFTIPPLPVIAPLEFPDISF